MRHFLDLLDWTPEEIISLLDEATRNAEATRREAGIEAREQAVKLRAELEAELRERRDAVVKIEERVIAQEDDIARKLTELTRREQGVADREQHLKQLQEDMKLLKEGQRQELERIASMTTGEARQRDQTPLARIRRQQFVIELADDVVGEDVAVLLANRVVLFE